ncbi:MAG: glycosyltransferase family 39 protein [Planctomycetes bacterium]|nr:glycosyltransferase family 39 protein [Planctomycetota bacterium]
MTLSFREAPGSGTRLWTRRTSVVLVVLVLGLLASLPWLVNPWHPAMPGARDAAMYLACAKSLVAGEGYSYLGEPFVIRPPGMSALLAPLVATRGFDFAAINLVVSLFGVATVALLFAWSVRFVGEWVGAALALCVFWNGFFQDFCNRAMTDVPGLATMFGALLLARWTERGSARRELVLGLALGVSAYLRTAALLLVPALVLERVATRALTGGEPWLAFARRRLAPLVLVPACVILPWSLRDAHFAPRGQVEQTRIASYAIGIGHVDPSDPNSPLATWSDLLAQVPERVDQVLSLVGTAMASDAASLGARVLGGVLLGLACVTLLRRRRAAEIYLVGYAAIVAVYFGFHERLVLPIWVLALVGASDAVYAWLARAPELVRSGLLVVGLAAIAVSGPDPYGHRAQIEAQHERHARFCAAVDEALERDGAVDARLGAPFGWHLSLYLDRPVWSLYVAWSRERDSSKLDELVAKHALDYVLLPSFDGVGMQLFPLLAVRFGAPRRIAGGFLFRVRR